MDNIRKVREGAPRAASAAMVIGHGPRADRLEREVTSQSVVASNFSALAASKINGNDLPVEIVRVLLVSDRTRERTVMEARLSIHKGVLIETVGDICSAATLVEWRHYSLLLVDVFGLGRSLVDLMNNFSQHSRESCVAFFGGKSSAMVKAAEMLAESRGLKLLRGIGLEHDERATSEFRGLIEELCQHGQSKGYPG